MTRRTRNVLGAVVVLTLVGLLVTRLLAEPAHVLLAGDSILRQTGPKLDETFGREVAVDNAALNNSGLLTPGFVDWTARLEDQLAEGDPEAVVFLFIGNYTDTDYATDADGNPILKNTPEFFAAWGREADRLMQVLEDQGSDAEVYWVLPPPQYTEVNQITTAGLRAEYQALAERWPQITLIDANDALAGPNGEYLASTTNRHGDVVPLRVPDTVHLTDVGARRLARVIHDAVDQDL